MKIYVNPPQAEWAALCRRAEQDNSLIAERVEAIVERVPAPEGDENGELQLLVSSIDYNDYVGRIGIGRIERGSVKVGQEVCVCNFHKPDEKPRKTKIVALFQIDGLLRVQVDSAKMGDVVCFSGAGDISIGDTITATGSFGANCCMPNSSNIPNIHATASLRFLSSSIIDMTFFPNYTFFTLYHERNCLSTAKVYVYSTISAHPNQF